MNIRLSLDTPLARARRNQRGMAVIVVIAIIAILLVYIGGNLRTLDLLSRDLKQVEQKQLQRLSLKDNSRTNPPPPALVSWSTNQSATGGGAEQK